MSLVRNDSPMESSVSNTELLIMGAGPAGLMAAAAATACGIRFRILEKRPRKICGGHADGLHPRSMEILHSFGLAKPIMDLGHPLTHTQTYSPGKDGRLDKAKVSEQPWKAPSDFHAWALSQRKIQDVLEEFVVQQGGPKVERGYCAEDLIADGEGVKVVVRRCGKNSEGDDEEPDGGAEEAETEIIEAQYVLACDGARSWTREHLGIEMNGNDTNMIWGVLDIRPVTDFPTPRVSSLIFSNGGDIMWLPREDKLVRLYVKLKDANLTDENGKMIRGSVTPQLILDNVRAHIHPYQLDYEYIDWWSAYQIGQRLATHNIDPASGRVFLAGDAVHLHSPHAGQGMNVSMQDSFNLIWKINLVLRGSANPKILQTYTEERLQEGRELIEFDRTMAAIASGQAPPPRAYGVHRSKDGSGETQSDSADDDEPIEWSLRIQGLHLLYPPSCITESSMSKEVESSLRQAILPPGIVTGMRMPSHRLRQYPEGRTQRLSDVMRFDGSFYLVIFAGDTMHESICHRLENLKVVQRLRVVVILAANHASSDPNVMVDVGNKFESWDVFYDDHMETTPEDAQPTSTYKNYAVEPTRGCLVLLRPDFYVGMQTELDQLGLIEEYLTGMQRDV